MTTMSLKKYNQLITDKEELITDGKTIVEGFGYELLEPTIDDIKSYWEEYFENFIPHESVTRTKARQFILSWTDVNQFFPYEVTEWFSVFYGWLIDIKFFTQKLPKLDTWLYYHTFRKNYDEVCPALFPALIIDLYYIQKKWLAKHQYDGPDCKVPYSNTLKHHIILKRKVSPLR